MAKGSARWTIICAIFLLLALALYYYLPSIYFLYSVRADSRNKPEMWQIPKALNLESQVLGTNKKVSFHGVQFSTPWGEEKVLRDATKAGLLTFGESRAILFLGIAQEPTNFRTLPPERGENATMRALIGETAMRSNYDLEREVLNATPGEAAFSLDRAHMIQRAMLLSAKWISATKGESGIYQFQTGQLRGFQKGNPEETGTAVLDIYDRNDRLTTMIISSTKNSASRLSQAEVNALLKSLIVE